MAIAALQRCLGCVFSKKTFSNAFDIDFVQLRAALELENSRGMQGSCSSSISGDWSR